MSNTLLTGPPNDSADRALAAISSPRRLCWVDVGRTRTRSDGTEVKTTHVETTDGYEYMVRVGDAGLWAFHDLLAQHPDQLSQSASFDAHAEVDALVAWDCCTVR